MGGVEGLFWAAKVCVANFVATSGTPCLELLPLWQIGSFPQPPVRSTVQLHAARFSCALAAIGCKSIKLGLRRILCRLAGPIYLVVFVGCFSEELIQLLSMNFQIEVSGLHKSFKTAKGPFEALRGVNLSVVKGEIFGFLGPNGAGKTTTLRILTTLLPFEKGEVRVAGVDVKENPQLVRTKVGYVSQKGGADRQATGFENLLLEGRLYGMSKADASRQAEELVETFSLAECIHRLVSTYSGGQQRRLDIALGMMHRPEILFLDEPTNGLDPQNREHLWSKILNLKESGVTIFLTSHYLDEVDALSDRLAIMDHGKIVASGTPASLKKEISGDIVTVGLHSRFHSSAKTLFEAQETYIREIIPGEQEFRLFVDRGELALPQILRLLDQENIQLETIQMSVPSLNDVFLKKTGRQLREGEPT